MTPEEEAARRQSVPSQTNTSQAGNWATNPTAGAGVQQAGRDTQQAVLGAGAPAAQAGANAVTGAKEWVGDTYDAAKGAAGDAYDWAKGAAGDVANFAGNAVSDFFSAETVNGPTKGEWGAPGTQAAARDAQNVQRGAGIQQGAAQQGQDAQQQSTVVANSMLGQANSMANRAAPTTNFAAADRFGSQAQSGRAVASNLVNNAGNSSGQEQQLQALNNFANQGAGPSAAQAQLSAAGDNAQLSALSMARSGRGAGDSASALRDATFSNAQTQATTGQNMATLRAGEEATRRQQQLQALDSAMGGASSIRGADTAAAGAALGVSGQALTAQSNAADQSKFNTNTQLAQTGMNDAARQGLNNSALGFKSQGDQTSLGFQDMGNQNALGFAQLGQQGLDSQSEYELQQQQMKLDAAKANQSADLEKDSGISGMIGAAAGAIGLSDERTKKLKKTESALASSVGALDTIGGAPGYSYEYKDPDAPGAGHGRQVSSMAQDLERGPRGGEIVRETRQGKMVDYEAVMKMTPGAITELNRKVKALESALGKGRAA